MHSPTSAWQAPHWSDAWGRILGRLQLLDDERAEQSLLAELAVSASQHAQPRVLAFVNAHALNLAARDGAFAAHLADADLLLRDGSGLALLLRWLGRPPGRNLNGTDLIPRLLAACNGQSLAVLGTRDPYLQQGLNAIGRQFMPRSRLRAMDGFQAAECYVEMLQRFRPQLVLLAMGMPRQEALAQRLREALDAPCLIICGGAIVDFLAGRTRRAPAWLRRLGLEWLWRLGQEPARLFIRYVVGNPLFVWRAAWLAWGMPAARRVRQGGR